MKENNLPSKLKKARSEKKISQEKLAFLLSANGHEISVSTLWRYERGGSQPNIERLRLIAGCLGKPVEYFI